MSKNDHSFGRFVGVIVTGLGGLWALKCPGLVGLWALEWSWQFGRFVGVKGSVPKDLSVMDVRVGVDNFWVNR